MPSKQPAQAKAYFESRVRHWAKFFQMGDFEFHVSAAHLKGNIAEVSVQYSHRRVDVEVAYKALQTESRHELNRTALHEVFEVLLSDMVYGLEIAYSEPRVHHVVNRVANALIS